jgi:hypothetical protein
MDAERPETRVKEFLASRGAPFYRLQLRLKMLHERSLNAGKRAVIFVCLAWGVPFVLALPNSASFDMNVNSYISDPGAWAKFFIAIAAFILAEQQVERGLRVKFTHILDARLIPDEQLPKAASAVATALKRRDSRIAEILCLALAYFGSMISFTNLHNAETASWAAFHSPEGHHITLAGWWTILVSLPLFVFLFARGLWRHFVWAQLLRRIAGLDLRLVATHPDGKGGLAFLARYPNAYMFFVFGMSSALAAGAAKHLMRDNLTITTFTMMMGIWLLAVLAFFAYPLSAFSKPLAILKERTINMLGAQATRFQRMSERKVLGQNVFVNDPEEAASEAEVTDPTKQFETAKKLSTMLVSRTSVVPVAAAALIPFAVAGATKLPYKEVFEVVKKLLLL